MTAKCLKLRLFLLASGLVKLTGCQTLLLVNKVGPALQRGGLGGRALQLCLVINLCAVYRLGLSGHGFATQAASFGGCLTGFMG